MYLISEVLIKMKTVKNTDCKRLLHAKRLCLYPDSHEKDVKNKKSVQKYFKRHTGELTMHSSVLFEPVILF